MSRFLQVLQSAAPGPILIRTGGGFLLCFALILCAPDAFPRLLATGLRSTFGPYVLQPLVLQQLEVSPAWMSMTVESRRLQDFPSRTGQPGPAFSGHGQQKNADLNLTPLIAITLFLAWPMTLRRRARALPWVLVLVLLAGWGEIVVALRWIEAQAFSQAWPLWEPNLNPSPDLDARIHGIQSELARLTLAKSFLSAGGRPFLAILAAVLGSLMAGTGGLTRPVAEAGGSSAPRPGT